TRSRSRRTTGAERALAPIRQRAERGGEQSASVRDRRFAAHRGSPATSLQAPGCSARCKTGAITDGKNRPNQHRDDAPESVRGPRARCEAGGDEEIALPHAQSCSTTVSSELLTFSPCL